MTTSCNNFKNSWQNLILKESSNSSTHDLIQLCDIYYCNNKINVRQIKITTGSRKNKANGANQKKNYVQRNTQHTQKTQVQLLNRRSHRRECLRSETEVIHQSKTTIQQENQKNRTTLCHNRLQQQKRYWHRCTYQRHLREKFRAQQISQSKKFKSWRM